LQKATTLTLYLSPCQNNERLGDPAAKKQEKMKKEDEEDEYEFVSAAMKEIFKNLQPKERKQKYRPTEIKLENIFNANDLLVSCCR